MHQQPKSFPPIHHSRKLPYVELTKWHQSFATLWLFIASFNFGDFGTIKPFLKRSSHPHGIVYFRSRGRLLESVVPSPLCWPSFRVPGGDPSLRAESTVKCSPSKVLTAETRCTNWRALRRTDAGNSSHSPKQGRKPPCTVWPSMTGNLTSR